MGRPLVLDASALLADIKDESGAEGVRAIMREAADSLFMHAVNASEVAYHLIRFGLPPALAFQLAAPKGVVIVEDLERRLWQRSAELKAAYSNLALGDCVAISLAESLGAELLTGDSLFKEVETPVPVKLFREKNSLAKNPRKKKIESGTGKRENKNKHFPKDNL